MRWWVGCWSARRSPCSLRLWFTSISTGYRNGSKEDRTRHRRQQITPLRVASRTSSNRSPLSLSKGDGAVRTPALPSHPNLITRELPIQSNRAECDRWRLSVSPDRSSQCDPLYVLLQQIERGSQQDNILHEDRDVAGHRGKSGNRIPAVRHERNDRDRGEESHGRTGGAENAEPLVPEACEQQRTEGPLGDAQEPAGALQAKCGIQPPDQWTVADERNESLRFVCPPLLVTEEQEDDHHRRADDVVIDILREQAEPAQDADKRIECGVDDR